MDKVVMVRNSLEEDVIHQWVSAHNSVSENYSFPKINVELIGHQHLITGRSKYDPIEMRLVFSSGSHIDIMTKCGEDDGHCCRIRESDMIKCSKLERPYVYFHNWHSEDPFLIILFVKDIEQMLLGEPQIEDKAGGKAFEGQKYYIVDCHSRAVVLLYSIKSDSPTFDDNYSFYITKLLSESVKGIINDRT